MCNAGNGLHVACCRNEDVFETFERSMENLASRYARGEGREKGPTWGAAAAVLHPSLQAQAQGPQACSKHSTSCHAAAATRGPTCTAQDACSPGSGRSGRPCASECCRQRCCWPWSSKCLPVPASCRVNAGPRVCHNPPPSLIYKFGMLPVIPSVRCCRGTEDIESAMGECRGVKYCCRRCQPSLIRPHGCRVTLPWDSTHMTGLHDCGMSVDLQSAWAC